MKTWLGAVVFLLAAAPTAAASAPSSPSLAWVDARDLVVRGRGFAASTCDLPYSRLPSAAQGAVTPAVWNLQRDSAGQFVQFVSDSRRLSVNVSYVYRSCSMWHFPSTGVCGMDLYAWDTRTSAWRWTATTHTNAYPGGVNSLTAVTAPHNSTTPPRRVNVTYRLHLPLYNAPAQLLLGADPGEHGRGGIYPDEAYAPAGKPIVWYGTSIAQGGVVTRPGMAFTNAIGRNLGREVLNFGFSGNGLMALEVAANLTSIDASLIVIDCGWNMQGPLITANVKPLVKYFRQHGHAETPIVLAETTPAGQHWVSEATREDLDARDAALRAGFAALTAGPAGDKHLHYVPRAALYNMSFDGGAVISPTVGGCHPTDLGQLAVADFYTAFLPPLLAASDARSLAAAAGAGGGGGGAAAAAAAAAAADAAAAAATAPAATAAQPLSPSVAPEAVAAARASDAAHATLLRDTVGREGGSARVTSGSDSGSFEVTFAWKSVEHELGVTGRAFASDHTAAASAERPGSFFHRLPAAAQGVVRDEVWGLSLDATGVAIPFTTNSSAIALNWTMGSACAELWHMPASGACGADLFRWDATATEAAAGPGVRGAYRYVAAASAFPIGANSSKVFTMIEGLDPLPGGAAARYLLFLSLRGAVSGASIGVVADGSSSLERDASYATDDSVTVAGRKPIVWYGTSIDQGGVASRPGSTYTNILTRVLRRVVLNFGFAGNGIMELSVAQFLAPIDAAVIVIDCLPNMNAGLVTNRTVPLVEYLRANGHHSTPIVLAAGTTYGQHWFEPTNNDDKRAALQAEYEKLVAAGDTALHLVLDAKDELFASNPLVNPTVGGTHPSDLGHREIANFYAKFLPPLLPADE